MGLIIAIAFAIVFAAVIVEFTLIAAGVAVVIGAIALLASAVPEAAQGVVAAMFAVLVPIVMWAYAHMTAQAEKARMKREADEQAAYDEKRKRDHAEICAMIEKNERDYWRARCGPFVGDGPIQLAWRAEAARRRAAGEIK